MLDPRVRTPRNVETILGFPPVAWLLEHSAGTPDFTREQVTRLASRIVQDQQSNGSRIFAFTSVKARGGTTSIVMDTAAAIGRLGLSTLAVEANAYRSDPRYNNIHSRGLTFVLRSDQDIASAVVSGHGEMPDYIPVGDLTDLKHLPEIQQLLERLRASSNSYAIVLIDLPPILVSVDAEFIARGADLTLLVIGAKEVTRTELRRAAACLERIGVSGVSAVLNNVSLDAGDGFARQMRDEFRTGTAPAPTGWFGRRFWR
jgi:Mrp family chromosome partitioning ATPase